MSTAGDSPNTTPSEVWKIVILGNANSGRSSFARALAGVELPGPGKVTGIEKMAPIRLDVDGRPCILDVTEAPARNLASSPQAIESCRALCAQSHGFFLACSITEPGGHEHIALHCGDIRRAVLADRKPSAASDSGVMLKDPIKDVALVVLATKWDLENDRATPSYALQSTTKRWKKPCIEISSKFDINVRLAAETLVRMMRVKHNKEQVKSSQGPTSPGFWKRKLKFKKIDFHEWWRFTDTAAVEESSMKHISPTIRAIILNQPLNLQDYLSASFASSKSTSTSQALSSPSAMVAHAALFGTFRPLHVAAILGRVECARVLLGENHSATTTDSHGKTAIFRAARNGQLRMLPLLLQYASKNDGATSEAVRASFTPAVLQFYEAEELPAIFKEISRCGVDLETIAKELADLHSFLSSSKSSAASTAIHVSKAIAAIKSLQPQQPQSPQSPSSPTAGLGEAGFGGKTNDSIAGLNSAKSAGKIFTTKAEEALGISSSSFSSSANALERRQSLAGGLRLRGYFVDLTHSLQSALQPFDAEAQIRVIHQIIEAVSAASPDTRFEVAKLVAQPLLQSLMSSVTKPHTFAILHLINALIVDSDRAASLFGAEGAVPPLIATMVSSMGTNSNQQSGEKGENGSSWDTQTESAIVLVGLALGGNRNKEAICNANAISASMMILSDNFRAVEGGKEKLFKSVLKLLQTLVSNAGIASAFCDPRTHPDALPVTINLARGLDNFSFRKHAVKVLSELARHPDLATTLLKSGLDASLFTTILNFLKSSVPDNDIQTPCLLKLIVRLSANSDVWTRQHGTVILPLLLECLHKLSSRKVKMLADAAELYRRYSQGDSTKNIIDSYVSKSGAGSRWTLAPSPALRDAALLGLGDFGTNEKLHAQIESLCSQLNSTVADQAVKAAGQLAELVSREGVAAKRALLELGGFAPLWKLLQTGKVSWQGEWLLKIDAEQLEFKDRIGHGSFGTVYSGILTSKTGKPQRRDIVAIKTVEEERLQLEDFKSELITLSLLNGVVKNIVEFKGYSFFQQTTTGKISVTKSYHCVVMELMETTLDKLIFNQSKKKKMKFKKMKRIAYEIARGMSELHHYNILHRDLKPANILLNVKSGPLTVKIADLGYARRDSVESIRKSVVGTPTYLAPELFLDATKKSMDVTKAADVYSFGILVYEMVTRKVALEGVEPARIAMILHEARSRGVHPTSSIFPLEPDCDPTLRAIVASCLSFDPLSRPSFEKICLVLENDLSKE